MNNIAVVKFAAGNNVYDFFNDIELKIGDTVVCDTAYGFSLGKVVGIKDTSPRATRWTVDKVDLSRHLERSIKRKAKKLTKIAKLQIGADLK